MRTKKRQRNKREYEEKESYKWQLASECMRDRLGSLMDRVISVCDREADIYEYLTYKIDHQERFVVRASADRVLEAGDNNLWDEMLGRRRLGTVTVKVQQRGGKHKRKARQAVLTVRAG